MKRTRLISLVLIGVVIVALWIVSDNDRKAGVYYGLSAAGDFVARLPAVVWLVFATVCGASFIVLVVRAVNRYAKRPPPGGHPR